MENCGSEHWTKFMDFKLSAGLFFETATHKRKPFPVWKILMDRQVEMYEYLYQSI